ncbi:cytochrome c oxidase subunit 3 [Schlesneria paludicola]|uniref:cytochrome c oxidase subunit 3 n=1 Tax=Schlesneria paludicola TaxID=360056 RepID=UPI00029A5BC6|nr:cytochrome c oxidase subunit 3 [Schlesneria paludicola]
MSILRSASDAPALGQHAIAHQFDDLSQQNEASDFGMWIFLATEAMFFGGLFLTYTIYRVHDETAFASASRHLDLVWGTINTVVLLTSSLTVVLAIHAAETQHRHYALFWLSATIALGLGFLGIKSFEYYEKYQLGLMPVSGLPFRWKGPDSAQAEMFFDLYYIMTGVHAIHMVIGLILFLILLVQVARGRLLGEFSAPLRITGLYWHFVDVVWVFLFPFLYLIGTRSQ